MPVKVFAINLATQHIKKEHILNECAQHHIDVEIISAISGKTLSEESIKGLADNYPACELTAGEIGCALSHLSIYQRMVKENIPLALILEDDATILNDDITLVLEAIHSLESVVNNTPQVYLLSPCHYYCTSSEGTLINHYKLHNVVDAYYANGYVLNLAAAQALASFLTPIKYEADRWGHFQDMGIVKVNCVTPALITTEDHDKARSDLEVERTKLKEKRQAYFRALRKREMSCQQKIAKIWLKLMITLGIKKVVRQKV